MLRKRAIKFHTTMCIASFIIHIYSFVYDPKYIGILHN